MMLYYYTLCTKMKITSHILMQNSFLFFDYQTEIMFIRNLYRVLLFVLISRDITYISNLESLINVYAVLSKESIFKFFSCLSGIINREPPLRGEINLV